ATLSCISATADCRSRPRRSTYTHPDSRAFSLRSIGGPLVIFRSATVSSVICAPLLVRITHADRKPLQPLDRLANRLAADRGCQHALHVFDVHAITGGRVPIDVH